MNSVVLLFVMSLVDVSATSKLYPAPSLKGHWGNPVYGVCSKTLVCAEWLDDDPPRLPGSRDQAPEYKSGKPTGIFCCIKAKHIGSTNFGDCVELFKSGRPS